jgi:hypothetical protein
MPRSNERTPSARDEVSELRQEVAGLKDCVRTLIDTIDEIRDELQYLNINGIRTREPLAFPPTLKRMAEDPCADDWNEQLVIDYGNAAETRTPKPEPKLSPPVAKQPADTLFAESGDQRQLF